MIKYLSALLLVLGCGAADPQPPRTPEGDELRRSLDATVALVSPVGSPYCAGVVWRGWVLTAAHCVLDEKGDPESVIRVGFRRYDVSGTFFRTYDYNVQSADPVQDFAVLTPDPLEPMYHSVEALLSPEPAFYGEKVVAIGHPVGLTYTVTEGIVSHPRRTCPDEWGCGGQVYMQVSAPIYFGNSGGPIFNVYGEIVGLSSFLVAEPHLAGVVHLEVIKRATAQLD